MRLNTMTLKNTMPDVFEHIMFPFGPTVDELNEAYMANSGDKIIAPLLERALESVHLTEFHTVFGESYWDYVGTIPDAKAQQIGAIITAMYNDKWTRLRAAMELDYDPIENYNSVEEEATTDANTGTVTDAGTRVNKQTGTVTDTTNNTTKQTGTVKDAANNTTKQTGTVKDASNNTHTETGTVTDAGTDTGTGSTTHDTTHGATVKTVSNGTAQQQSNVFGFNTTSPDGVPSDKSNGTNNVTQDVTNGGTDKETSQETRNFQHGNTRTDDLTQTDEGGNTRTDDLTQTVEGENTRTDDLTQTEEGGNTRTDDLTQDEKTGNTRTDNLHHEGTRKLTRHGNIGVTTSQQMLLSEIELRQWNFYRQVFQDLDAVLTCPVY